MRQEDISVIGSERPIPLVNTKTTQGCKTIPCLTGFCKPFSNHLSFFREFAA